MWFSKRDPESIARKFAKKAWENRTNEGALASLCAEATEKLRHVNSVSLSDSQLSIDLEGGPEHCIWNLAKPIAHLAAAESVDDARHALHNFLASTEEIRAQDAAESDALNPDDIVPLIRSEEFAAHAVPEGSPPPAALQIADGLILMFAEDRPWTFRYLRVSDIRELAPTPDALIAAAVSNMQSKMAFIEIHATEVGISYVACGGNFEASLLLAGSFWRDMSKDFAGPAVAAVPAGDLLAFADSENHEAVQNLRQWVQGVSEDPEIANPISFALYRFNSGSWELLPE